MANISCGQTLPNVSQQGTAASWRSGYAADCKSVNFDIGFKVLTSKVLPDRPRTGREPVKRLGAADFLDGIVRGFALAAVVAIFAVWFVGAQ